MEFFLCHYFLEVWCYNTFPFGEIHSILRFLYKTWRMRSPIRVFISVGFVSIQFLARDSGLKLGFAAKNWLAYIYICLFSKPLPHIFINKLLKTFQNINFISKSTFTPLTLRNVNFGRATPWGTKGCKKSDTSSYDTLSFTTCLCLNFRLNLPYLYQTKSHQIPQRIHHFCLQWLKFWRYRHMAADPSFAYYYMLPFLWL